MISLHDHLGKSKVVVVDVLQRKSSNIIFLRMTSLRVICGKTAYARAAPAHGQKGGKSIFVLSKSSLTN